jgi:hypothetical protein
LPRSSVTLIGAGINEERPARFLPGWRVLVLCTVLLPAGVALAVQAGHDRGGVAKAVIVLGILCLIAGLGDAARPDSRRTWPGPRRPAVR